MRRVVMWAVVGGLLLLSACGGQKPQAGGSGGSGAAGGATISVEATEFQFSPKDISTSAGSKTIELKNKGSVEHDFTVDALGIKLHTTPGETKSTTAELKAGSYEFYCSIPGHKEAGMVGKLTVS
jgi:uncharacterized cupredoxin-like copper-binding protein